MTTRHEDASAAVTRCPHCGTARIEGAVFCEACAHDFTADDLAVGATPPPAADVPAAGRARTEPTPAATLAGTPETAPPGEESPLDVGWTGPAVVGEAAAPQSATPQSATPQSATPQSATSQSATAPTAPEGGA